MNGTEVNSTEMIKDIYEIQFPELGWKFHIDPTAFTIAGIDIQWYALIIISGLLLAMLYCFPRMKKFGVDSDKAIDAVIGGVIGGIIGARIYYVLMNLKDYKKDTFSASLLAAINIRSGGLAIYGGIIGAVIVGLTICRIRKIKILPMLDISVIGFLIGQGIGRWGNFVNQEAFGTNTDFILGMTGGRIQRTISNSMQSGGSMFENGLNMIWEQPVHPCFFYESVWCLLGFVILAIFAKHRKYDGQLLLMYMAWYGAERAVVEGLRTDSLMIGSIRVSQAVSIIILVASVILQIIIGFKVKRDPESFVLYCNTPEAVAMLEEARLRKIGIEDDNDLNEHIISDDEPIATVNEIVAENKEDF